MTIHFTSADQALRKARTFSKKGAIGEAEAAYRWVLENFPNNKRARDGLRSLGAGASGGSNTGGLTQERVNALITLHRQGRFAEAIEPAQSLAVVNPDVAFLQNFLGVCNAALGQVDQAIPRYQRALELAPNDAEIHANLGDALNAVNHPEEAAACFRQAIELNPDIARCHNNLGSALVKLGDLPGAARCYARAVEVDPGMVDAHNNLGLALIKLGEIEEGEKSCRQAIKLNPHLALAHVNLAHAHDAREETDQAIDCLETAISLMPDDAGAYSNLCEIYDRSNRVDDMRAVVARAREQCNADDPRLLYRSAQLASRDKDDQTARNLLEKMPDHGLTATITEGRMSLLGKSCDRLGDHPAAFEWFERINEFVKASPEASQWKPEAYRQEIEALIASYAGISEKPWAETSGPEARAPVFLVGFPRSGTTLLDTILRSHPDIIVLEEMQMVFRMRELLDGIADRQRLETLTDETAGELRNAYMTELHKQAGDVPETSLIIDKLPLNIVHAGLIHRVLPSAKFIFAIRHPCDCVLSCFMQNFKLNNPMANFLDLEASAVLYDKVMRLWTVYRDLLKPDVHSLVYEDLVADMEPTVAPLLEFLGLNWDDRMHEYRQTALARGRINTPSYNQVTEKLYRRASGRWENYREQLEPVLPLLMPWAKEFGY